MKEIKDGVLINGAVTISGTVPVTDNGGSLTVDGTVAATQSGTWNVNNISGTVSLPTGAATSANQSTIIGHVDGIETLIGTSNSSLATIASAIKLEDDAALNAGAGIPMLVARRDTPATASTTNGDWEYLQMAGGRLWTSAYIDGQASALNVTGSVQVAGGVSVGGDNKTPGNGVESIAYTHVFDGSTWDRAPGNSTDGLLVNLGANNDVTVSGTVAATQSGTWNITNVSGTISLPTGAATEAKQDTMITALQLIDDTIATSGGSSTAKVVQLGGDNFGTATKVQTDAFGNLYVASASDFTLSELPNPATAADATSNPSISKIGSFGHVYNGSTWDRLRGDLTDGVLVNLGNNNDVTVSNGLIVANGGDAHDAAITYNPIAVGGVAVAHGTNPTAVDAGDVTRLYANRHGVLFNIGGHPNVVTVRNNYTAAQTDTALITVSGGTKIVVTRCTVTVDKATTVDVGVRIGFGAANTPTGTGVVLSHPGIAAGSGVREGNGGGILGIGGDGEDLRITSEVPTTGSIDVVVTYYTIES